MTTSTQQPLSHPQARQAHGRRLAAALADGPWTARAVELGRELTGDTQADPVSAALAAADHCATPSRRGAMWDGTWEDSRLADGRLRWSNAIKFASRCRLGLDHGLALRDLVLDIAQPDAVVDFGAGTGASLLPWVGTVGALVAVEPAPHFRTFGAAIVPEATWCATTEDAPSLAVEGGVVAVVFCHVLNVATLDEEHISGAVGLVADADEIVVATASNTLRSSRIASATHWLETALRGRGFEWHWPRSRATLGAGWGTHELEAVRWVRR